MAMSTAASAAIYREALAVLPGGNTRTTVYRKPHPIYGARGMGCRITDVDEQEYIDLTANFTSLIHGHAHPALVEAATAAIQDGTCFGMPTRSEVELARILCGRVPTADRVRFTNSGTEAVMMAIKAARAFTGRAKIAKCEGAYHGSFDVAEVSQSVSPINWGPADNPNSVGTAAGTPVGVLDDVVVIPFNEPDIAETLLRAHSGEIAAVLVDPMPNRAGLVPATETYLETLRKVSRDIGALLIFDEVISFRLGYHGAQGRFGIAPDLTALGKFIGGGFPVGAVVGTEAAMSVFDPTTGEPAVPHGGTFSANPVTMHAGIASMKLLTMKAFEHLEMLGTHLSEGLERVLARHDVPGQVTGLGSLRRLHLTNSPLSDYRSAFPTQSQRQALTRLTDDLLGRGVFMAPTGLMALSTVMTAEDVELVLSAFDQAFASLSGEIKETVSCAQ
jgi:glutamate-1-semialdehyde 2,1-aminomutase